MLKAPRPARQSSPPACPTEWSDNNFGTDHQWRSEPPSWIIFWFVKILFFKPSMSGHQSQSGQLDWTNCFSSLWKSPATWPTCPFSSTGAGNLCLPDIAVRGPRDIAPPNFPVTITLGIVRRGLVKFGNNVYNKMISTIKCLQNP